MTIAESAFEAAWPDEPSFLNEAMQRRSLSELVEETARRARARGYNVSNQALETVIVRMLDGVLVQMRKIFESRGSNVQHPDVIAIYPIVDHFQDLLGYT